MNNNHSIKLLIMSDLHLGHSNQQDAIILEDFKRTLDYATNIGVESVLLLGDTFDKRLNDNYVAAKFLDCIRKYDGMDFLAIYGNHELNYKDRFENYMDDIPDNLIVFQDDWEYFELESGINVYGISCQADSKKYNNLKLDDKSFNIVMMHVETCKNNFKNEGTKLADDAIFKSNAVDVLCLGHTHNFEENSKGIAVGGQYYHKSYKVVPGTLNRYARLKAFADKPKFAILSVDVGDARKPVVSECRMISIDSIDAISTAIGKTQDVIEIADKMYAAGYSKKEIENITSIKVEDIVCKAVSKKRIIDYNSYSYYKSA